MRAFLLFASALFAFSVPAASCLAQGRIRPYQSPGSYSRTQERMDALRAQSQQRLESLRAGMVNAAPAGQATDDASTETEPTETQPAGGDSMVAVPGTRIRLQPPPGFVPATSFKGFEEPDTKASITVIEIAAPYRQTAKGAAEDMEKNGVKVLSQKSTTVAKLPGTLIKGSQNINGVAAEKWVALFGDDRQSTLIVATYRATDSDKLGEPLKASILGAQIDRPSAANERLGPKTMPGRKSSPSRKAETAGKSADKPAGGELVRNTHVRLERPEGFVDSTAFTGWQQDETGASIVVLEMPVPLSVMANNSAEEFSKQGMTLKQRKEVDVAGGKGHLFAVTQTANEVKFNKWILLVGDAAGTALVTANFPAEKSKALAEPLRKCLLTAQLDRAQAIDPFADAKFTLTVPPEFKFVSNVNNIRIFAKGVPDPAAAAPSPTLMIAVSPQPRPADADGRQFAESLLPPPLRLKVESTEPIEIDGLNGFETLATGEGPQPGKPVTFYQVVLLDAPDKPYYAVGAIAPPESREQLLKEYKATARSFKRKP